MIPLSSRCCCVSSITTPFSWVDWFWRRRRKHKREVLKLLRGQILCGRHKAERIDFGFNRGRSLSLQRAMAWVDPSRNTSEDQRTGSNGGECGLAHLVLSFVWCEPTTGVLQALSIGPMSPAIDLVSCVSSLLRFCSIHALQDEEALRVCPKTSGGITKFSEHEAD